MLSIGLLERVLNTKLYPCGGTYINIDMTSEEALPPTLGMHVGPCRQPPVIGDLVGGLEEHVCR